MNVAEPVAPSVLIQYMMGRKLQFTPGEYNCNGVLGITVNTGISAALADLSHTPSFWKKRI